MDRRGIVVTGAAGFVGANLVRRLAALGHEVHAVVHPQSSPWRLDGVSEISRHRVDLTDEAAVRRLFATVHPEWTFHLAAHGAYSWQTNPVGITAVNLTGTSHVVRSAVEAGCQRIVCAGSSSEYGFKDHAPSEDEVLEPNSEYAVAKASATLLSQWLSRSNGVPVTTLRLYSVFGPFEDPARLLPSVIREGLHGHLPKLANPDTARDFVHVDDVVAAFILAADNVTELGAIFNVGTGRQVTLREVADVATQHFGLTAKPQWGSLSGRGWDTNCWVGEPAKLLALGWRPEYTFETGFTHTASWWAAHRDLLDAPSAPASRPDSVDLTAGVPAQIQPGATREMAAPR